MGIKYAVLFDITSRGFKIHGIENKSTCSPFINNRLCIRNNSQCGNLQFYYGVISLGEFLRYVEILTQRKDAKFGCDEYVDNG